MEIFLGNQALESLALPTGVSRDLVSTPDLAYARQFINISPLQAPVRSEPPQLPRSNEIECVPRVPAPCAATVVYLG